MKRPSVRWSARAEADLMAIGEHFAQDKPGVARAWVERLRHCAHEAALAPMAQRRVPEIEHDDLREALHRGYRVVFKVRPRGIDVLTVFEGHKTLSLDDDGSRAPNRQSK